MEATQRTHTVKELIELRKNSMLAANPEYQRGAVWTKTQQKKLIDSVLRGYPLPVIYLHHIKKGVGEYARDDFEIIDGQQRINAIYEFSEGAFALFDPKKDIEARFPAFISEQTCPWAHQRFDQIDAETRERFLATPIPIAMIETHQTNEVRDLFVRLQSGLPLNHQETRDAWPGNFTDFILKIGGKPELPRYPGHPFFSEILKMKPSVDRGKTRQLSAQIAMLFFTKRDRGLDRLPDINSESISDFYYANLDFDPLSANAERLRSVFDRAKNLLANGKRPKLRAHDAIHLILLIDSLLDDYAPEWQDRLPAALDKFLENFAKSKVNNDHGIADEFWTKYGQWTRVNSDRGDVINRRHRFYIEKMLEYMSPMKFKDPQRVFGEVERTILYFKQGKKCLVCDGDATWDDIEVHHVEEHQHGGPTSMENGAVVHKACHPKGSEKTQAFAQKFAEWKEASKISIL